MTTTSPTAPAATSAVRDRPRARWYALGTLLHAELGGHSRVGLIEVAGAPGLHGSIDADFVKEGRHVWTADARPVGSVTLALLLGVPVRRRTPHLGLALLGALAMTSLVAATLRPTSTSVDVLPGFVTAVVGAAAGWFLGLLDRAGEAGHDPLSGAGPDHTAHADGRSDRRHVLAAAAGLGVVAAAGGTVGQALGRGATPASVTLPAAAQPLPALPAGLEDTVRGVSTFRTPNSQFYRIDTALVIPGVRGRLSLTIDSDVERPSPHLRRLLRCRWSRPTSPACRTRWAVSASAEPGGSGHQDLLERAGVRRVSTRSSARRPRGCISTRCRRSPTTARAGRDRDERQPLPAVHGSRRLVTPASTGSSAPPSGSPA